MRDVGLIVRFLGLLAFGGGVIWLRFFVLSFKDVGLSLALMVVGVGIAVAGDRLFEWAQSRTRPPSSEM